ncbi:polysaccharide deacetylase [Synergistales bacterium]|nr:polysaccharide deacetylase [Synergistales bacterium]
MIQLGIKVDVDTLKGYTEGVPRLLDLFGKYGKRVSVFFSFGPDNSGKAIRRVFRKGFLSKMMRTKAPSTYGFKTLLYGTLLPAPMIVPSAPDIFKRAVDEGHDCGVHSWDHVFVQDKLYKLTKEQFEEQYDRAAELFDKLSGKFPRSYAAPGWQVSKASLSVIDERGLKYASDSRGTSPFLPVVDGEEFRTLQIPTTLPTMDEIIGLPFVDDNTMIEMWVRGMSNEWNVLTIHAEMEGMSKLNVLEKLLQSCESEEVDIIALDDIAAAAKAKRCEVKSGEIPGRAGTLAVQADGLVAL